MQDNPYPVREPANHFSEEIAEVRADLRRHELDLYELDEEDEEDEDIDPIERMSPRAQRMLQDEADIVMNSQRILDPQGYKERLFAYGDDYTADSGDEKIDFLVDGFLPRGYLAILGGSSKAGKSCLATALAMAVAKGEPFLGMPVQHKSVLWCAYEESVQERRIALRPHEPVPSWFFVTHKQPRIDNRFDMECLEWWVEQTKAGLLVIDPLFSATRGSLSDGRTAREAMMNLKQLAMQTGVTILVLHHINKDSAAGLNRDRFAESNQILATASMDLLMDWKSKPDGSREIRLQGRGRGDFANRTWLIRSISASNYELMAGTRPDATASERKDDALLSVLAGSSEPMTAVELSKLLNEPTGTTRNRLTHLVKDGAVMHVGNRSQAHLFALARELHNSHP